MYLVSSSEKTVLSDFINLETCATYEHPNGEVRDFQFYNQQRIFLEVDKRSGVEIMRIKENSDHRLDIQRVRKLNIEKVYCVACAKQSIENMAFGGVNGQVSIYNYNVGQFVHRFKTESSRNSVVYLDYNGTDEYISSVFESGDIGLYGTKTRTKVDTINIDSNSTLARFHPTKRFHLSVASYRGAVTIYDVQVKRKVYNSLDAHRSPCRDLCMTAAAPDTLISVGFDCVVNIFDTRRKKQPIKLRHSHPLSTVALSNCGTFFCVGNLKGDLISYDLRNTKVCLTSRKIHNSAVTRISFVSQIENECTTVMPSNTNISSQTLSTSESILNNSNPSEHKTLMAGRVRDSFCDFLDFQSSKRQEKASTISTMHRDSFDWEILARKSNNEVIRESFHKTTVNNISVGRMNNSFDDNQENLGFGQVCQNEKYQEEKKQNSQMSGVVPLRDRANTTKLNSNLMQIEEERPFELNQHELSSSSDKENPPTALGIDGRLRTLPSNLNSTPNRECNAADGAMTSTKSHTISDISKQINDLHNEMQSRFKQLEFEIKLNAETNKWQMFTQASNFWNQQTDNTIDIRDALGILLQTDPFVSEFLRLKEENDILKERLQRSLKK